MFHRINLIDGLGIKININNVVTVSYGVGEDNRKFLHIVFIDGNSTTFIEGITIEDVMKEFNRFPS